MLPERLLRDGRRQAPHRERPKAYGRVSGRIGAVHPPIWANRAEE